MPHANNHHYLTSTLLLEMKIIACHLSAATLLAFCSFLTHAAPVTQVPTAPSSTTAAPVSPSAATNRVNFANGIRIIYRYADYIQRQATSKPIPRSNLSVISRTCTLFSTYKTMMDGGTAGLDHLTSLLQSTMTHGCLHVRDLLAGKTLIPTEGSGEGLVDSCSELQYLDTLCDSSAQAMTWSIVDTSKKVLDEYINDEHFDKCRWLRDNKAAQYIRNLFRC